MDVSTLLSGAGNVALGVRDQEARLRQARMDQLAVEAENRRTRQRLQARPAPMDASMPNYGPMPDAFPVTPGLKVPTAGVSTAGTRAPGVPAAQNPTTTLGKKSAPAPAPVDQGMTQEQFLAMSPEQRKSYLQTVNDRRTMKALGGFPLTIGAAATDLATAPYRGWGMVAEGIANSRFGRAVGLTDPGQKLQVFGTGSDGTDTGNERSFPLTNKAAGVITDNMLPYTEEQFLQTLPIKTRAKRKGGSYAARQANASAGLVTGGASQYDKPTPYDDLITQSAQAEGIDPVVFKRLLGTESSFDPTAVSPRGESFGLGIGQIADSWGLSREQRLDPNTAIPAAAKILAQYVNAAGGDYEAALLKYKGASSDQGKASMAPVVKSILGAVSPVSTAAAADTMPPGVGAAPNAATGGGSGSVAIPAAAQAAAPTQNLTPSQFYLANPNAITDDMQTAMKRRAEYVQLANMYLGMGTEDGMQKYMEYKQVVDQIDSGLTSLAGMQGVRELREMNDPRRLAQVLSYMYSQPVNFRPHTDGTYDYLINGKVAATNVKAADIEDRALSLFDPSYRQTKQEWAGKEHEAALKLNEILQGKTADMIKELYVAQQKGNIDAAIEKMKMDHWIVTPLGDGTIFLRPPGTMGFTYNPAGTVITRDGVEINITGAQPIAGLNVRR